MFYQRDPLDEGIDVHRIQTDDNTTVAEEETVKSLEQSTYKKQGNMLMKLHFYINRYTVVTLF